MSKILWISPYAPYDKVFHAGGKNHNYYIKYLKKNSDFDITLLSLCFKKEEKNLDLDSYGIKNYIKIMNDNFFHKMIRYLTNFESEFNPFNKYVGTVRRYQSKRLIRLIKDYSKKNIYPDIIILHWTQVVLLTPIIKKLFSDAKLISIEEDVTFLSYERKMQYASNVLSKKIASYKYRKIYKLELEMLNHSDCVVVLNEKDANLLRKNDFAEDKIFVSSVYFDNHLGLIRNVSNRNIIYYGAMGRKENYLSAIWFIKNVLPLLAEKQIQFVIIGGGVNGLLKKYQNEQVKILGYVEDLSEIFSECLCLVAPLVLGAGIKVKVLEALSAGIPVLTNDIGIEGINAIDGKDYLHCTSPEKYAERIMQLLDRNIDGNEISCNARIFVQDKFDLDNKLNQLISKINLL